MHSAIKKEPKEKDIHYGTAIKGSIFQPVAFMSREGLMAEVPSPVHGSVYQKILPALTYAKENYADKITTDKLCEHLKIDKYNFCKQFKYATGATFFDYLTFLRLRHAEELLLVNEKNVTEIALSCGFSTVQYFNRVFSARYGFSLTAYRKMLIRQESC